MLIEKIIESKKIIEEIKRLSTIVKNLKKKWILTKDEVDEIDKFEAEIDRLKGEVFECDIIVDSPLTQKINDVYLTNLWEKYRLLSPSVQKQLFWKELVRFLERWEYSDLYSSKNKNKKQVIISSSWMCQWWRIISHLMNCLEDENSTLIFTWYTPENTLWWAIKSWGDVKIGWIDYEVKCRVVDLKWFSWHIDESEILDLLWKTRLTRKTIVSLNHGWESRLWLSEKVLNLLKGISNKTKVIVPEIWSSYVIKI
jgi:Cft2 family RNA processing exonuclease